MSYYSCLVCTTFLGGAMYIIVTHDRTQMSVSCYGQNIIMIHVKKSLVNHGDLQSGMWFFVLFFGF